MWGSLGVGVRELLVADEGTEKSEREEGEGEGEGEESGGGLEQMFRVTDEGRHASKET
jgi:hypothetical protein